MAPECAAGAPEPLLKDAMNILTVLCVMNVGLLFVVGLLARLVLRLDHKQGPALSRFLKARAPQPKSAPSKAPPFADGEQSATVVSHDGSPADGLARELVAGHVHMIRRTLSNQSLRSSLSADDFASLQCMLGDEDGVTM
ncbi:hypothetical protein M885DRAFT_497953 [Pelagophyceae sp. CCMP2097]|nr:hypothetical protein M885DRAFT_497953 [Pelagophyceae sp. CCMP2097]